MGSYISTSQSYEHFVNKQAFLRISRNYFSEPRQPKPIVGTRSSAYRPPHARELLHLRQAYPITLETGQGLYYPQRG